MNQIKKVKTIFVGMSGGVDSSVTAYLLRKRGYNVVGVFMRSYNLDGCADRDAEDARRVAEHIGIPFYVWDFEAEYKKRVVDYMIEGYRSGITPNPDVMCNREIKFGIFFDKARAMGADYVATGHYVRLGKFLSPRSRVVARDKLRAGSTLSQYSLFEARDTNKDQSYFLWTLTEDQLEHCLFPIGDYIKPKVREIARIAKLPTADKKDSQGICFLGMIDIFDFLKQHIPPHRGPLITTSGEHIGEHSGSEFYTIGQRHIDANFKFPKTNGAVSRKPFYVAAKDAATNTVIVAEGSENIALYKKELNLTDIHFINPLSAYARELADKGMSVFARVRYRQPLASAMLTIIQRKSASGPRLSAMLIFEHAQKFVAPGQSAVFYAPGRAAGKTMLGGGVIL